MRKHLIFIIILFSATFTFAQPFGNEWINYSQKYYKIPITKEGIYRISRSTLENSGYPINSYDPRNIQIFYRGQEQYIYLQGENDGIFHTQDFIEFYAKGNDGWLDSALFEPITDITNPFYSMYTDTAYYFLTYNNSLNNRRASFETDINFSAYSSFLANYCMVDVLYNNPQYFYNADNGPRYLKGEGWFESSFGLGQTTTKYLFTPGYVAGITPSTIKVSIATNSSNGHHLNVLLGNTVFFDTTFSEKTSVKNTYSTTATILSTTNISFSSINDIGAPTDNMQVAYLFMTYARNLDFNSLFRQNFRIPNSNGSKSLLQISQFGTPTTVLWDITNHRKITTVLQGGFLNAIVPNGTGEKTCYIADTVYQVSSLKLKIYTNYLTSGFNSDYIIITNPLLNSGANAYRDYRNTTGFNAYCYDVEQLYDQFAYGVKKHPLAIKNFLKFISTNYDSATKYVFLIGKNIHSGTWLYNESFRKNSSNFANTLVPSYGSPSCDNLLTTKILSNNETQDIPIGRIAATNNNEVNIYLSKIIAHEGLVPAEWMKRIIHFGGGTDTTQQREYAGYLNNFGAIISDTLFGGNVNTFLKNTSLPIQITVSDSVRNLINDGTSLITFFGHGYTDGFDQNIEEPDNYFNNNKYPLLIANSCLTGDIHLPAPRKVSERWIFSQQKGAIGFLATVDLGYPWNLNLYTTELYKQFAYKNYTKPIGKCIKDGNRTIYNDYGDYMLKTCLEFTLHGDPAVNLKSFPLPDLTINSSSISFVPEIVTVSAASDSFDVKIIITNIGKAINDTFAVTLTRTLPNGTTFTYTKFAFGCHFKDTLYIKVPLDFVNGPGINHFCVNVDSENWIAEMSETNNSSCTDLTIRSGDLTPIFPYEFAIHPNNTVTLMASTGYPFIGIQNYAFEIDTTDLFMAPLESGFVNHSGGIVSWTPNLTLTDSTVYFWRVSPVPQGSGSYNWKESSFTYIPGKTGWSQAHFFQLKKDGFSDIDYNRTNRKLDFVSSPKELRCHNKGLPNPAEYFSIRYYLDAVTDYSSCGPNGAMLLVVIDPTTLVPWESEFSRNYGQVNWPSFQGSSSCPSRTRLDKYFVFHVSAPYIDNLATFLTQVPDSFYILAYSFNYGAFQTWPEATYQSFEALGATKVRTLANDIPYIFYAKKGDVSTVREEWGDNNHDTIDLYVQIPTHYNSGHVRSTLIGPSTYWKTLHWKQSAIENPTKDQVHLETTAFKPNNDSSLVIPYIPTTNYNINDLYNYADASQFPYLRLSFNTKDDSLETPAQLSHWQITYDEAPETAINPSKGLFFHYDTLQEGDIMKFAVATENISQYNMDSLRVRYWLQDKNNQLLDLGYRKLRPHPAGDILIDTITFNTSGHTGLNHIWYEVNPTDTNTGAYDQVEQYHFNNYAEKPFVVLNDKTNPLLDVTFDGIHIMNGDIVSAKPYILTNLKDENKFLGLNDTALFGIYLTSKSTGIEKRIYFNSTLSELQWTPALLPNNSCIIEYRPTLDDGKYQLRIQAKDISNNESGSNDYRINFEVINKSTITNVYNYPNPFSTSTRFVFTLTGSEIPDDFRIQIITVTGKFVREIGLNELGLIHIGNNITQFAWDGTDMYGDKLANGVYFFKVIAKLNSETIEHRATDADKFFKEGFGKMYILR
jgi:hypothetical protein